MCICVFEICYCICYTVIPSSRDHQRETTLRKGIAYQTWFPILDILLCVDYTSKNRLLHNATKAIIAYMFSVYLMQDIKFFGKPFGLMVRRVAVMILTYCAFRIEVSVLHF